MKQQNSSDPSPQASPEPRAWTCSECHQSNLLSDTVCQHCRKIIRIDDNPKRQFQYGTYIACCLCNCNVAGNKTCQYNCICHDNAESRVTAPVGQSNSVEIRKLAEKLVTRRHVHYKGTQNTDYFVYAFGHLLWLCQSESQADKIYGNALNQSESVLREAAALASPPQIAQPDVCESECPICHQLTAKKSEAARDTWEELKECIREANQYGLTLANQVEQNHNGLLVTLACTRALQIIRKLTAAQPLQVSAEQLAERLKAVYFGHHPNVKSQWEAVARAALAATPPQPQEIPLCANHAESWFCDRNHLASEDCVVCAFAPKAAPPLIEPQPQYRIDRQDENEWTADIHLWEGSDAVFWVGPTRSTKELAEIDMQIFKHAFVRAEATPAAVEGRRLLDETIEAWQEDLGSAETERREISDPNSYAAGYSAGECEVTERALCQFKRIAEAYASSSRAAKPEGE